LYEEKKLHVFHYVSQFLSKSISTGTHLQLQHPYALNLQRHFDDEFGVGTVQVVCDDTTAVPGATCREISQVALNYRRKHGATADFVVVTIFSVQLFIFRPHLTVKIYANRLWVVQMIWLILARCLMTCWLPSTFVIALSVPVTESDSI
jgi:hypothetical protein